MKINNLLDTISRLILHHSDTCVACFLQDNKIFWASNQKRVLNSRNNWENLKELINLKTNENYIKVVEIAINRILELSNKFEFIS